MNSIKRFIPESQLHIGSPAFEHHYLNFPDFYGVADQFTPRDLAEWIYYAQLIQADSLAYVMGIYRSRQFRSSGSLFWQFQSSWPEGAYSIVDCYGEPKMAAYWLRPTCNPLAVIITDPGWQVELGQPLKFNVHLVNGRADAFNGTVLTEAWNRNGEKIFTYTHTSPCEGQSAMMLGELTIPADHLTPGVILVRSILTRTDGETATFDRIFFVGPSKNVTLTSTIPGLTFKWRSETELEVINTGKTLIPGLELQASIRFTENYFNLVPGETKMLTVNQRVDSIQTRCLA